MQMLQIYPLVLISAILLILSLAVRRRKHSPRTRVNAEERSLWGGLAAGLFDADHSPAGARLEIALLALAARLKVRGAMISVQGEGAIRIAALSDPAAISGLRCGQTVVENSLYNGALAARDELLVINYASLSEWRRHPAHRERGWETFLGINCGVLRGENVVVAFFDTAPRETPFSRSEELLVRQLAPWVAAMLGHEREIFVPRSGDSSILEKSNYEIDPVV